MHVTACATSSQHFGMYYRPIIHAHAHVRAYLFPCKHGHAPSQKLKTPGSTVSIDTISSEIMASKSSYDATIPVRKEINIFSELENDPF